MRLDRDAALALQVHRIEQLFLHLAVGNCAGAMQQAVGKRRFSVVDVGDDAEISYVRCVHRSNVPSPSRIGEGRASVSSDWPGC